jgi:hypothetical protein
LAFHERCHVVLYAGKLSQIPIDQKGALIESGKVVATNMTCMQGDMSATWDIGNYKRNGWAVPHLWFTSFLRNKISKREIRIEAAAFSPKNSSKLLDASRLWSSFLFTLFECPFEPSRATIKSINFTTVEAWTCAPTKRWYLITHINNCKNVKWKNLSEFLVSNKYFTNKEIHASGLLDQDVTGMKQEKKGGIETNMNT